MSNTRAEQMRLLTQTYFVCSESMKMATSPDVLALCWRVPFCAPSPDDGKLSFDEFKSYFSDGVLTAEELQELFHTIDTHNTE